MSEHPPDAELFALAVGDGVEEQPRRHVEECGVCRERIATLRRVAEALLSLPPAVDAPPSLWSRVQERTRAGSPGRIGAQGAAQAGGTTTGRLERRPSVLWALRAAAAAAFFLAGAAFQAARGTGPRPEGDGPPGALPSATRATPGGGGSAAAIQEAGTDYVAAIARLAADARSLPPQELEAAREVAFAAIYGATHELAALGPDRGVERLRGQARSVWLAGPRQEAGE